MKLLAFKNNVWLFVTVLLTVFAVSTAVRYQQFETWEKTPVAYFVGERPMMTTLDAPYWLRWAREYNEGVFGKKNGLAGYPERTRTFKDMSVPTKFKDPPDTMNLGKHIVVAPSDPSASFRYRDVPLLSFLIANISPFFNYNYYLTGTLLIPVFASLFILPLGLYFFQIGAPVSGLLGGLIGTFAGGYYMRSSIGRIDTDMLNLFFPVLVGLFILLAGRARTEQSVLLYSVGAGLSLFLFQWWYGQSGFSIAYFMLLVFGLFLQRVRLRIILLSALLFILCTQPVTFMVGTNSVERQFNKYFVIEEAREDLTNNDTTSASFPNTMTTISESNHVPMDEVLRRVLSNTTLDWIGLLAFFGLVILKWRVLVPLAPVFALGLLSFQSSNRFIMYLAPFIGIGLGWLLQLGIEGAFYFLKYRLKVANKVHSSDEINNHRGTIVKGNGLTTEGSLWIKIIVWLSMDSYPNGCVTNGTEKDTTNQLFAAKEGPKKIDLLEVADKEIDRWNWGRQGALYLGMAVFFWFISGQTAISFVPAPSISTGIYATFLEVKKKVPTDSALLTWWDYGYAITDSTGLATFHNGGSQTTPKTYFIARSLISSDQDELYDITQYLATEGNPGIAVNNTSPDALLTAVRNPQFKPWDPIYLFFTADMTGKFGAISKLGSWDIVNGGSKPRGYQNLACNKITSEEMNCSGAKIDLKAGKINNKVALKRVLFIRNGKVMREQKFGHTQGYTLQMLVSGKQIVEVQLIDEEVYRSNYNQMFLLGLYDEELFEETYNAFPFSRLYKVKF
jgi:hypothetical protein